MKKKVVNQIKLWGRDKNVPINWEKVRGWKSRIDLETFRGWIDPEYRKIIEFSDSFIDITTLKKYREEALKTRQNISSARESRNQKYKELTKLFKSATNIICKKNNLRSKSRIAEIIIEKVKIGYDEKNLYIEKIASWLEKSNYYPLEDYEQRLKDYIRKRIKIPPKPRT